MDGLSLALKKGDFILKSMIDNKSVVIIDFLNIYCSLVGYKGKLYFDNESILICLDKILEKFKKSELVIIVSKNISEISDKEIDDYTKKYTNLVYIYTKDYLPFKRKNKERDDFLCILFQKLFINKNIKSSIITNDKYNNLIQLIENIHPFYCKSFKNGGSNMVHFEENFILVLKKQLLELSVLNCIGFKFRKRFKMT